MLKLLRNFALAGLLLAGIMKLLAWWVVGRDVEHVVAALAPYAQIKYDGVSTGLDGSVTLGKVSVDAGHRVYRADSVVFEAPSLFWLFGHAFMGGTELPGQFSVSAEGLKLPPLSWLDPQLFDTATFVPFPAAGCGSAFSEADYQRMGVQAGPAHERLDYRYDADQHTLSLALKLKTPGFAQVDLEADLKKFDPAALAKAAMWDQIHLDQVTATYMDLDYLDKRNRFCAQRNGGGAPVQFIERHIAAVQELLKQKRAEPSGELVQLYRTLLEHGGQASLLSLPSAGFVLAAVHTTPEELLRQLNVTARYKDKPPIMFRVAFAPEPEEPPALATGEPAQTPATAVAAPPPPAAPTAVPPSAPPSTPAPATPVATPATAAAKSPPPTNTSAPAPPPTAGPPPTPTIAAAPTPAVSPPVATKTPAASSTPKPSADNLGLHSLDRDEARLAAITPPLAMPPKREIRPGPVSSSSALGPSADAPPAGSLEASLWKPSVYEALPSEPEERNYDTVDYGRLASMVGRYVQVITEGGKKIGGLILGADDTGVTLQVNREGGNITFVVARTRVQEIRLPRY